VRVRRIEKSEILLELVRSAEIDEDISQEDLIQPFKPKSGVYQRLQELCVLTPYLSENQAKDEFLSALNSVEGYQESARVKGLISSANTACEISSSISAERTNSNNISDFSIRRTRTSTVPSASDG
jgi:DNA primase